MTTARTKHATAPKGGKTVRGIPEPKLHYGANGPEIVQLRRDEIEAEDQQQLEAFEMEIEEIEDGRKPHKMTVSRITHHNAASPTPT